MKYFSMFCKFILNKIIFVEEPDNIWESFLVAEVWYAKPTFTSSLLIAFLNIENTRKKLKEENKNKVNI